MGLRARKGLETLSAAKQLAAGNRRPEKRATKCAKSTTKTRRKVAVAAAVAKKRESMFKPRPIVKVDRNVPMVAGGMRAALHSASLLHTLPVCSHAPAIKICSPLPVCSHVPAL